MKGVTFVTDSKNKKIAVQIDLKKNGELWEDFCDYLSYVMRKNEKRVSLDSVIRKVEKNAKKKS